MEPIIYILIGTIGFMYLVGATETLYAAEFGDGVSKTVMTLCRVLEYTIFLPFTLLLIIASLFIILAKLLIKHSRKKS